MQFMKSAFLIRLAAVAVIGWSSATLAQAPSAAQVATARQLVELKGGTTMFDPIILGIVNQTGSTLLQTNPQLSKDLNEVAVSLRTEFTARRVELINEAAKYYAARFTEAELKELVTFFSSALGKKMVAQEPLALDETFQFIQQWSQTVGEQVMNRFRAEMKKKGHNL
jgi:hypothetical protein